MGPPYRAGFRKNVHRYKIFITATHYLLKRTFIHIFADDNSGYTEETNTGLGMIRWAPMSFTMTDKGLENLYSF